MAFSTLMDLTGRRFGKLTVLSRGPNVKKAVRWNCICDCGNQTLVHASALRTGNTAGCGCTRIEKCVAASRKHGKTGTVEYKAWQHAKGRCYNPKDKKYGNYGARGITMCDRWLNSFEAFLADMGPRPPGAISLDRIDSNKGYSPENCRWANALTQGGNTRRVIYVTLANGTRCSLRQAAIALGIKYREALQRYKHHGAGCFLG